MLVYVFFEDPCSSIVIVGAVFGQFVQGSTLGSGLARVYVNPEVQAVVIRCLPW